jgi:hypothetical protein
VTFREPLRVAASTPTEPPPSGGDWIPVATDGRVRHEALRNQAGWKDPPSTCRSRSKKLGAV